MYYILMNEFRNFSQDSGIHSDISPKVVGHISHKSPGEPYTKLAKHKKKAKE